MSENHSLHPEHRADSDMFLRGAIEDHQMYTADASGSVPAVSFYEDREGVMHELVEEDIREKDDKE